MRRWTSAPNAYIPGPGDGRAVDRDGSPDLAGLDPPLRVVGGGIVGGSRPKTGVGGLLGGAAQRPQRGRAAAPVPVVSRNPYKGLRPFETDDARDFFGRDQETQRLVELVAGSRLVVVVGPSGSGKSSLVRAGLVPALSRGRWPGRSAGSW